MSSVWHRLQFEFHDIVSKLVVTLGDPNQGQDSKDHDLATKPPDVEWLGFGVPEGDGCRRMEQYSDWMAFGVPEGDGCRRLEPTSEIDAMKPEHNTENDQEDYDEASHAPTEIEQRFALLQKIINFLTVLKMYADIITTDYALVCSATSLSVSFLFRNSLHGTYHV